MQSAAALLTCQQQPVGMAPGAALIHEHLLPIEPGSHAGDVTGADQGSRAAIGPPAWQAAG